MKVVTLFLGYKITMTNKKDNYYIICFWSFFNDNDRLFIDNK